MPDDRKSAEFKKAGFLLVCLACAFGGISFIEVPGLNLNGAHGYLFVGRMAFAIVLGIIAIIALAVSDPPKGR